MDYSIHDALEGGFEQVVVVVRPDIESLVRRHLASRWDRRVPITYARQPVAASGKPGGTAPALLSARALVGATPFAVINSDDLYGPTALARLRVGLAAGADHQLVGYRLAATLLPGSGPVNRALCDCHPDGTLARLVEATVTVTPEGRLWATPAGGGAPEEVGADRLVSMNAWGFAPAFWAQLDEVLVDDGGVPGARQELLLPDVVGGRLGGWAVAVLPVPDRCLSLTWPSDLVGVRDAVSALIGSGTYPNRLGDPRA